jgi:hypothetical protein
VFLSIIICFTACSKQVTFDNEDKEYVFTFEDLKEFNIDDFVVQPMKNGKDYFYTKTSTNNFRCMYGITLADEQSNRVKLTTSINIQPSNEKAIQLFESSGKTLKAIYKTDIVDTNPKDYNVNQLLIINSEDFFSIVLVKDNLFYQVDIDGEQIREEQVRDNLLEKIDFIVNNDDMIK